MIYVIAWVCAVFTMVNIVLDHPLFFTALVVVCCMGWAIYDEIKEFLEKFK